MSGRAGPLTPSPALAPGQVQAHLKNAVLLRLVHLARQAAVRQGVVDDELVGLGAGLLVQPWTWRAGGQQGPPGARRSLRSHLPRAASPVYSGTEAGEEALLPFSQSRSRLPGSRLGDMRPEGDGALQQQRGGQSKVVDEASRHPAEDADTGLDSPVQQRPALIPGHRGLPGPSANCGSPTLCTRVPVLGASSHTPATPHSRHGRGAHTHSPGRPPRQSSPGRGPLHTEVIGGLVGHGGQRQGGLGVDLAEPRAWEETPRSAPT